MPERNTETKRDPQNSLDDDSSFISFEEFRRQLHSREGRSECKGTAVPLLEQPDFNSERKTIGSLNADLQVPLAWQRVGTTSRNSSAAQAQSSKSTPDVPRDDTAARCTPK